MIKIGYYFCGLLFWFSIFGCNRTSPDSSTVTDSRLLDTVSTNKSSHEKLTALTFIRPIDSIDWQSIKLNFEGKATSSTTSPSDLFLEASSPFFYGTYFLPSSSPSTLGPFSGKAVVLVKKIPWIYRSNAEELVQLEIFDNSIDLGLGFPLIGSDSTEIISTYGRPHKVLNNTHLYLGANNNITCIKYGSNGKSERMKIGRYDAQQEVEKLVPKIISSW